MMIEIDERLLDIMIANLKDTLRILETEKQKRELEKNIQALKNQDSC